MKTILERKTNDWTGNTNSIFSTHGASNHSVLERAKDDYYATDPKAVIALLKRESFQHYIWEPACGGGHISKVLESFGCDVKSSDIVYRGYEPTEIIDFLKVEKDVRAVPRDIITNPPYKYAKEFVEKALEISMSGIKIAMLLKLTFLEGKGRAELFKKCPPCRVYVFSSRINCGKNGNFENCQSAVAYAWYVWEKDNYDEPVIRWI